MFAQFLDDMLRATMMKMQRRECRTTLEYKDQVRPAQRRARPTKRLQVFYVKIHDIFSGLRRCRARSFVGHHSYTSTDRQTHTHTHLTTNVRLVSTHLPTGHSLFHGHAAVLTTEALLLPDHACGTVYLLISNR